MFTCERLDSVQEPGRADKPCYVSYTELDIGNSVCSCGSVQGTAVNGEYGPQLTSRKLGNSTDRQGVESSA